ncbi:hypothetical protein EDB92DRAFT_1180885 [Lactarius akahatsu]|uniref:Uncharacterized protein n=1 Tax=Lactarius akahatsu TaxID=416441 RepID=A0AAD4LS54_9AGAM|nr:hypothetical protein EDB92DRAFT_1180885 [Lactarius akahatsu]
MGKSAKVHKRTRKTASGASTALTTPPSKQPAPVAVASAAKKKASTRKGKAKRPRPSGAGPVLGGADYVDIMFGSRRREREEAQKLPRGDIDQ